MLCSSSELSKRQELLTALRAAGFVLDHVSSLDMAEEAITSNPYQVAIVADGSRRGRAVQWIRRGREQRRALPILLQMHEDNPEERIAALEAGADDCFRLPILPRELVARVRALMRRPPLVQETALLAGNARLDPETREVWISEQRIKVPRREVSLLEQLMRRSNRVVPRLQLEANLYGMDDDVGPNSIEVSVSRIRRRLQDAGATVSIQTVRGIGYCLTAQPTAAARTPPEMPPSC